MASSAIPAEPETYHSVSKKHVFEDLTIPDPSNRAVADSFLKSLAADWATCSTTAGAMAPASSQESTIIVAGITNKDKIRSNVPPTPYKSHE